MDMCGSMSVAGAVMDLAPSWSCEPAPHTTIRKSEITTERSFFITVSLFEFTATAPRHICLGSQRRFQCMKKRTVGRLELFAYGAVLWLRAGRPCKAVSRPAESIQDGQPQYELLSSAVPFTVMSRTVVLTAGRDPARSVASVQGS